MILIFFSFPIKGFSENKNRGAFEYGKLIIFNTKSIEDEKCFTLASIFFSYGDSKEILTIKKLLEAKNSDAKYEAYKDFILKYKNGYKIPDNLNEISILNLLGNDGWEIIDFTDETEKSNNGFAYKYLFKRIK
jgi:hypothetical protein